MPDDPSKKRYSAPAPRNRLPRTRRDFYAFKSRIARTRAEGRVLISYLAEVATGLRRLRAGARLGRPRPTPKHTGQTPVSMLPRHDPRWYAFVRTIGRNRAEQRFITRRLAAAYAALCEHRAQAHLRRKKMRGGGGAQRPKAA